MDKLIGKYVIVRCRDAGVHSGILESAEGRSCTLTNSRRLWYWKPVKGAFLSAVAVDGVHSDSKIGKAVSRIALTENCEIIECTKVAADSLKAAANSHE